MKVQWKKQSGPLLVSSCNLVSAKTRKRGADDDQSDPHRREYRSDHAVPVPRLRAGSNEWKLGFTTEPGATPRVRTMPARDLARLTREIADAQQWFGLKATTPVRSCYEAGRDGFWLHRYVTSLGIANVVVDSSSIEVNRRLRRAKSDALDVRKLLGMLLRYYAGERAVWSVVRVPTVEEEDRRQLHRELRTLKQERTRVANRITGLLATQGIGLPRGPTSGPRPRRCACGTARACPRRCGPGWGGYGTPHNS